MLAHRLFFLTAFAAGLLIVSCAAPTAPTTAPTQPASQSSSSSQSIVSSSASQSPSPTVIPTQAPTQTAAPSPTTVPTAVPTKAATQPTAVTKPTATAKMNMDEIFPPGAGRETVLDNCTTCHTFVPLVILQYTQAQWDLSARNHRDRVPRLTDADFNSAFTYLAKNFNPDHPIPKLPKELLDTWTDY